MRTEDSLEKTLILGKMDGKRQTGQERMRWLNGVIDMVDMNLDRLGESGEQVCVCAVVFCANSMQLRRVGHDLAI